MGSAVRKVGGTPPCTRFPGAQPRTNVATLRAAFRPNEKDTMPRPTPTAYNRRRKVAVYNAADLGEIIRLVRRRILFPDQLGTDRRSGDTEDDAARTTTERTYEQLHVLDAQQPGRVPDALTEVLVDEQTARARCMVAMSSEHAAVDTAVL